MIQVYTDKSGRPVIGSSATGNKIARWERMKKFRKNGDSWEEIGNATDEAGTPLWVCDFNGFGRRGEPEKVRLICASETEPDELTEFDLGGGRS